MSKASRLRLRNERRRNLWLIAVEPDLGGAHFLHRDGWHTYTRRTVMYFNKRRDADKIVTVEVLKDPSLIGRVWITKRLTIRNGPVPRGDTSTL